jgi:GT2 family glycosyltransferase
MISIIVTSYNRVNYLVKSLNSLSKQTFQDFEVILVTNFQYFGDNYGFKCIKYIVMDGKIGEFLAEGIRMSNG